MACLRVAACSTTPRPRATRLGHTPRWPSLQGAMQVSSGEVGDAAHPTRRGKFSAGLARAAALRTGGLPGVSGASPCPRRPPAASLHSGYEACRTSEFPRQGKSCGQGHEKWVGVGVRAASVRTWQVAAPPVDQRRHRSPHRSVSGAQHPCEVARRSRAARRRRTPAAPPVRPQGSPGAA